MIKYTYIVNGAVVIDGKLKKLLTGRESLLAQNPIFILGFPRSGTTLLQSLLATQNSIVSFPETHFFDRLASLLGEEDELVVDVPCNDFFKEVQRFFDFDKEELDLLQKKLSGEKYSKKYIFEMLLAVRLCKYNKLEDLGMYRLLEKTPDHIFHLDEIHNIYPEAKFIFMLRDPINSISSYREVSQQWGEEQKPVEILCDIFLTGLKRYERFVKEHPKSIMFVRLEDLVDDSEKTVSNVLDFLGVDFTPETLNDYKDEANKVILPWEVWKRDVSRKNISKNVAERLNKKVLSEFEEYRIRMMVAEPIEKYGYQYDEGLFSEPKNEIEYNIGEIYSSIKSLFQIIEKHRIVIESKGKIIADKTQLIENIERKREDLILNNNEIISQYKVNAEDNRLKILDYEKILKENDQIISKLKESVLSLEGNVNSLTEELNSSEQHVQEQKVIIGNKLSEIKSLQKMISDLEEFISTKIDEVKHLKDVVSDLEEIVAVKNKNIERLDSTLGQIYSSRTWNLMVKLRGVADFIFPRGSFQKRIVNNFLRLLKL